MDRAEQLGRRKQHIRDIRHHFLSHAVDPDRLPPRPAPRCHVRIGGRPASPWLLPLAVNLALAARAREEACLIVLPERLLAVGARLLGAPARALEPCFEESVSARPLELCPGLAMGPPYLLPLLAHRRDLRWQFTLGAAGGRGPWLYLETEAGEAFVDPRAEDAAPLFLLGLDHVPAPRAGVTGIWGGLPAAQLLDPARPAWTGLAAGAQGARQRFGSYLEALRHANARRPGGVGA